MNISGLDIILLIIFVVLGLFCMSQGGWKTPQWWVGLVLIILGLIIALSVVGIA